MTMAETPISKLELAGKLSVKDTGIMFLTIKHFESFLALKRLLLD
jgi:hypothetical protein